MDLNNVIRAAAAVASVVVCGVALKNHNTIIKTERAKREQIRLDTEKEIAAIRRAGRKMVNMVERGDYDHAIANGGILEQLAVDQKFYVMTERFDD